MAIGRFIRELLHDMGDSSAVGDPTPASPMNTNSLKHPHENSRQEMAPHANVLIYSGHDSTLVPLLCAVGLYKSTYSYSISSCFYSFLLTYKMCFVCAF